MKTIRAKFVCESISPVTQDGNEDVSLRAVVSGSEENKMFWHWTPCGHLQLSTINHGLFTLGQHYYIDLTPTEP